MEATTSLAAASWESPHCSKLDRRCDFSGLWVNQRMSLLRLKQADKKVTGTFDSGVGDDDQKIEVSVVGWASGDRIAFTTTYPKYGTVVAWVGQLMVDEQGDPVLVTHWLHETNIPENAEPQGLWASTRIGSDRFTRSNEGNNTQ